MGVYSNGGYARARRMGSVGQGRKEKTEVVTALKCLAVVLVWTMAVIGTVSIASRFSSDNNTHQEYARGWAESWEHYNLSPSGDHTVTAFSDSTAIGQDIWRYNRVYWQWNAEWPEGQSYKREGEWDCYAAAVLTNDEKFGGYLLSHGVKHAVCFLGLERDGWVGPADDPALPEGGR